MPSKIIDKTASAIILFLLALTAPWWLLLVIAFILILAASTYWSAIFSGLIIDILYAPHDSFLISIRFTLIMIVLSLSVYLLKKRLIFY